MNSFHMLTHVRIWSAASAGSPHLSLCWQQVTLQQHNKTVQPLDAVQQTKTQVGVQFQLHSFFNFALDSGDCSASKTIRFTVQHSLDIHLGSGTIPPELFRLTHSRTCLIYCGYQGYARTHCVWCLCQSVKCSVFTNFRSKTLPPFSKHSASAGSLTPSLPTVSRHHTVQGCSKGVLVRSTKVAGVASVQHDRRCMTHCELFLCQQANWTLLWHSSAEQVNCLTEIRTVQRTNTKRVLMNSYFKGKQTFA